MRYVHIIARLKVEVKVVNKVLADICDMTEASENVAYGFWKDGDWAMWRMLCALEDKAKDKYRALNIRIAEFEYRRDFGTS